MAREKIAGPDSGPQEPFPIKLNGRIVKGFGRGSSEGSVSHIPTYPVDEPARKLQQQQQQRKQDLQATANLPVSGLDIGGHSNIKSGVYYGWAAINMRGAVNASDAASAPTPDQDIATAEQVSAASARSDANGTKGEDVYEIYRTVLSIGYNPFYKNSVRSVEIHVMHKFEKDFYNAMMNLSILGFIRPERDYDSMEALITDIKIDIDVAEASLKRDNYVQEKQDSWLGEWGWDR